MTQDDFVIPNSDDISSADICLNTDSSDASLHRADLENGDLTDTHLHSTDLLGGEPSDADLCIAAGVVMSLGSGRTIA